MSAKTATPRVEARVQHRSVASYWPQYVAISPFYLLFAVFGLFPIGFSIYLSFHDWNGLGEMKFVGLSQYAFLLGDARFWNSVFVTFVVWFLSTIPMLVLALVLAFLLHQDLRGKSIYRAAFFVPNVTSMVAMTIVFISIFSDSFGLANGLLKQLVGQGLPWMTDPAWIRVTIAIMVIWRFTGYNAIIYLAGLQSIPTELYEAARVDGANTFQVFTRITVPLLRPVILFTVITSTIGGLSLFTEPQVLLGSGGGPQHGGETIVLYQYNMAFNNFDFGYGAAIGWALFLIAGVFAFINWRLVGSTDGSGPGRGGKEA